MKSHVGEVWQSEQGGVFLIIGVEELPQAKGGWVWDMRTLWEPGGRFAPGRWVHMHPEYLEEHLTRITGRDDSSSTTAR